VTFDDIRAANPALIFNVYAMEAGGPVVLEVIDDGTAYTFTAPTLAAAIDLAFPPTPPEPEVNAFD
jgi:hypothetical protein